MSLDGVAVDGTPERPKVGVVSVPWVGVPPKGQGSIAGKTHRLTEVLTDRFQFTIVGGSTGRAPDRAHPDIDYVPIPERLDKRYIDRVIGMGSRLAGRRRHLYHQVPYHPVYVRRAARVLREAECSTVVVHEFPQWLPVLQRVLPEARLILWAGADSFIEIDGLLPYVDRADALIGASRFLAERMAERAPRLADRTHVVYSGVDLARFHPGVAPRATDRILYAGRITPEKGVHHLVDAFRVLAAQRPDLRLVLAGPPWITEPTLVPGLPAAELAEITELAGVDYHAELLGRAGPAADRISMPGSLRGEDLVRCMQEATVFCHPVLCPEGFGAVVAEAMACGAPTVVSERGAQTEYVLDGVSGVVSPAGDVAALVAVLGELLDDAERRAELGRGARQIATERLDARVCATAFADVLDGKAVPVGDLPAIA